MNIYKPQRIGSVHIVLPLTLLFLSAISFFGACMPTTPLPQIAWSIGFLSAGATIVVLMQMTFTIWYYEIDSDSRILMVNRVTLAYKWTPYMIALDKIEKIEPYDKNNKNKEIKKYRATLNLFTPNKYSLLCKNEDGKKAMLIIETNDEFINLLKK